MNRHAQVFGRWVIAAPCGVAGTGGRPSACAPGGSNPDPSKRALHSLLRVLGLFLVMGASISPAWAGPPFLTDDPVPVGYRHNEFYIFSTYDGTSGARSVQGPAIEYNRGVFPQVMFHIVVPYASVVPAAGPAEHGIGDTELGIKYRFLTETRDRPQIGIFPMAEVPTGDADRGLGNGRVWYRLPVWVQKSWGPWTTDAGVGYALNHAPGSRSYPFGGWLLQRQLSDKLILGGELFAQGADTVGGRSTTIANFGGYYNVTPGFSLLFSAGHSIQGESHTVAYLGLYWTWGPAHS